jgi:hypothetical protein
MNEKDAPTPSTFPKAGLIFGGCALSTLGIATALAGVALFGNDYFFGDRANHWVTWAGEAGIGLGLLMVVIGALHR